jgi:hypothetical protein
MILKFKNKHIMALDKMIKDAAAIDGAIIDSIILDQKEALGLILEAVNLSSKDIGNIRVTDLDGVDITTRELVWNGTGVDKNEHVKNFVNSWYKLHYRVKYLNIPMTIVKPKPLDVPKPNGWTDEPKGKVTVPKGVKVPAPPLPPPARSVGGGSPKPKAPPNSIIQLGNTRGFCDKCGSSLKSKWFFFKAGGCIQPDCENYWERQK